MAGTLKGDISTKMTSNYNTYLSQCDTHYFSSRQGQCLIYKQLVEHGSTHLLICRGRSLCGRGGWCDRYAQRRQWFDLHDCRLEWIPVAFPVVPTDTVAEALVLTCSNRDKNLRYQQFHIHSFYFSQRCLWFNRRMYTLPEPPYIYA